MRGDESAEFYTKSPYAIKAVSEALFQSYGAIKNPEAPAIASYEHVSFKKIAQDGYPSVPKLMFSLINGGKAIGSKVKFAKFYLIMNYQVEDLRAGDDALMVYHKAAQLIKKNLSAHK